MDSPIDESQTINFRRPRSLKHAILERGCPELKELTALRAEGWRDELLRERLNDHFTRARKSADESTPEGDSYWLPIMASAMEHMDTRTRCIPEDNPLRFLDLGCCPGGFSNYVLTKNPASRGVGVSLGVEHGGHSLAISSPESSRFEMHWGDLTYFDICSPRSCPAPPSEPDLLETPFRPTGFQLAMLDGQHRRPQESASTHVWDIDRLLIAQIIIAMESLDSGGTFIVKLNHLESSTTARLLYMIDKLSRLTIAFKPYVYGTRGSFYAIGIGFGLGVNGYKRAYYLHRLKNVWWEMTFGGLDGKGRWLEEHDLDFIIDLETLRYTYLDRLIKLGRGTWRAQSNALRRAFVRIRAAAQSGEVKEIDQDG